MCVCPISVKNKKIDFDPLVDRLYNCVPCGKCYECQESKRNGYEVRALYEYLYTHSIGGVVYYFTLTYDNKHVPKLPESDIMCGSKNDIQNFIKRLRKYSPCKLRYFITSEYGDNNLRPHYHGLIYFDSYLEFPLVHSLFKRSWSFGFMSFGENHGIVKDARVFNYVSKYVCKDIEISRFFRSFDSPLVSNYYSNTVKFRNKFTLPLFHLQSQNFGLSICSLIKDNDLIKGYFIANDIVGLNRKLTIPLYIYRKLLYETYTNSEGNISYKLNNRGVKLFKSKMLYQFKHYNKIFNDAFILADNIDVFNNCPTALNTFLSFPNFQNFLNSPDVKNGVSWLVAYKLLYHDVKKIPFTFEDFRTDLQIYIDCVFNDSWVTFDTGEEFVAPFSDEIKLILVLVTEIISYFRYRHYLKNVDDYNRKQLHKSLVTREYKPLVILSFDEFKNNVKSFKTYRSCLTTCQKDKLLDPWEFVNPESLETI